MAKVTFDGPNLLISVNTGITSLDAKIDLYSDWKEWLLLSDNAKFLPAFRTIGGDNLGGGLLAGAYFFLQNQSGWRIRPQEANHELVISGNLYPESSLFPIFTSTLGPYTVAIQQERSSLTQVSGGSSASEVAAAVWGEDNALTVGKFVALK